MIINLPETYNWVMFTGLMLLTECLMIGFIIAGGARRKVFTKEFMAQFNEEHEKAFGKGTKPNKEGYPDTGNGFYSQKLPY